MATHLIWLLYFRPCTDVTLNIIVPFNHIYVYMNHIMLRYIMEQFSWEHHVIWNGATNQPTKLLKYDSVSRFLSWARGVHCKFPALFNKLKFSTIQFSNFFFQNVSSIWWLKNKFVVSGYCACVLPRVHHQAVLTLFVFNDCFFAEFDNSLAQWFDNKSGVNRSMQMFTKLIALTCFHGWIVVIWWSEISQ